MTDQVVLGKQLTLELAWNVRTWDQAGTFAIAGGVISGNPDEIESELSEDEAPQPFYDFGPLKLRVQEQDVDAPVKVTLGEAKREETYDQTLWGLIRRRTINFSQYRAFIDEVLCDDQSTSRNDFRRYNAGRPLPFSRSASYAMLRNATEFFLMQEAGAGPDAGGLCRQRRPQWQPQRAAAQPCQRPR